MPPVDLPPQTPQGALRLERFRDAVVCPWTTPEPAERPHAGEPDIRLFHSGTSSTSLGAIVVVNEPVLDSVSNLIIQGIRLDREPVIRRTSADYGRS